MNLGLVHRAEELLAAAVVLLECRRAEAVGDERVDERSQLHRVSLAASAAERHVADHLADDLQLGGITKGGGILEYAVELNDRGKPVGGLAGKERQIVFIIEVQHHNLEHLKWDVDVQDSRSEASDSRRNVWGCVFYLYSLGKKRRDSAADSILTKVVPQRGDADRLAEARTGWQKHGQVVATRTGVNR